MAKKVCCFCPTSLVRTVISKLVENKISIVAVEKAPLCFPLQEPQQMVPHLVLSSLLRTEPMMPLGLHMRAYAKLVATWITSRCFSGDW